MEFSIQLTKETCKEIVNALKKRSEELYNQQLYSHMVGNNNLRQKYLEQLMIVENLLSQYETFTTELENGE